MSNWRATIACQLRIVTMINYKFKYITLKCFLNNKSDTNPSRLLNEKDLINLLHPSISQ